MKAVVVLLSLLCCARSAFAVGNNTLTMDGTDVNPDPNSYYHPVFSAPVLSQDGTSYWSELLRSSQRRLNSSGGQIAFDARVTSVPGDFPIDLPTDVQGSTLINQGFNFVQQGDGSFLEAPGIFQNGATKLLDYTGSFPGITADQNLQVSDGLLDDDGTVIFLLNRSQFFGAGAVNAMGRLSGGSVTILLKAGVTRAPDGSKFTYVGSPSVSHGVLMFYGETSSARRGVYQLLGKTVTTIVDSETRFPATGGVPAILSSQSVQFSNEGTDLAIAFTELEGGVYKRVGGKWSTIARTLTPIPNGQGIFFYVASPALYHGRVAFVGGRNNVFSPPLQVGIYAEVANGFATVINESDDFGGHTTDHLLTRSPWWNGTQVAAEVGSTNWSGVCRATVAPHPLTVQDDSFVIRFAGPNALPVLNNDTGPWGSTLRITAVTQGAVGLVRLVGDTVTYTPGRNFVASDQFTYTVTDGSSTAIGHVTVTDPFLALRGSVSQVIVGSGTTGSGLLAAAVTGGGQITGRVQFGAHSFAFRGALTDTGAFGATTPFGALTLQFALVNSAPQVSGTLTQYPTTYTIPATRLTTTAAIAGVAPGSYTLRIAPDTTPAHPQGYGWALLRVSATGSIVILGKLGDGTPFSTGSALHGDSTAPLYASLYANPSGSIGGMLTFENLSTSDVGGSLVWVKPAQKVPGKFFPSGFQGTFSASGSLFAAIPAGLRSFIYSSSSPAQAVVKITDPAASEIDLTVSVTTADVCAPVGANLNSVLVKLDRRFGLLTGSYLPTGAHLPRTFLGVQDVKANVAAGAFLTSDATGAVVFQPQ